MKKEIKDRYYTLATYFRNRGFEENVYKISVDAGFSCPNRDGTKSKDGCIFCMPESFSVNTRTKILPINEQIENGMRALRNRYGAKKFVLYFQPYTNTYGSKEVLKEKYDIIRSYPEIVGLAIGTRPDCINADALDVINEYSKIYDTWIEVGLQSANDSVLDVINRGHTLEEFINSIKLIREFPSISICAHVIVGLPGESKDMMVNTAKLLGKLKIDGVKIHPMHVVKGTKLDDMYNSKEYNMLSYKTYIDHLETFVEYLWPETVIERITADCPRELLVGPLWINDKPKLLKDFKTKLVNDKSFQGKKWHE